MKIAIVNKFFFIKGGQESLMFEEAELLQNHGHQVAYFSMHHPKNISDYKYSSFFVDHVELSNLGKEYNFLDKLKIARNFIYNHKAAANFERFLKTFQPDIIHCHGIAHQLSPSILFVAKKHNIPVVQTLHDYQLICPNYTFMLSGKNVCIEHKCINSNYYNCFKYKCIKNSITASALGTLEAYFNHYTKAYTGNINKFIAPSHFLRNLVLQSGLPDEQIDYIPNFINYPELSDNWSNDHFFLYAGRLSFEKGLKTLLKAFKDLPDISLKVVGTGPLENELLQYVKDHHIQNIEFTGFVDRQTLLSYLRSCEAMILPSEWYENAPMSILECFAMEKPVIGAKIGGIPEMVTPAQTGFLFTPGNVEELQTAVRQFSNNSEFCYQYGKTARLEAMKRFNKEIHIEKLLQLYNNLLK